MNEAVRENLLGYLLDALDESDRAEVDRLLETDSAARRELQTLQKRLQPLKASFQHYEPPAGLADRTCDLLDEWQLDPPAAREADAVTTDNTNPTNVNSGNELEADLRPRPRMSEAMEPGGRRSRWTLADLIVGLGVCSAAAMLFFPAIFSSWVYTRRLACENNLRQMGIALADFAEQSNHGRLPHIPARGNRAFAGFFAPVMSEAGYLNDKRVLICPASTFAKNSGFWNVPRVMQIDRAEGPVLVALQRRAGGSYGYNIGFMEDGEHRAPSARRRQPFFVWMADAPSGGVAGQRSENHGGKGQNMLFADLSVRFLVSSCIEPCGDDVFRNHRGIVEPGVDENDAVVAASVTQPFMQLRSLDR